MLKHFLIVICFSLILISCNNNKTDKINQDVLNDSTLTIDQIGKLIRENPKNADLFIRRSELYLKADKLDDAINDLEIALKVDTLRKQVYLDLSELYIKQGHSEKSKDILKLCLARFPFYAEGRIELARLYFLVQMYSEAMMEIMNLENNKIQNADSYFLKALILNETEAYPDAIKALKKTLEYNTKHWEAYNLIGLIYARQKDKIALEYFKTAVGLFPDNSEIRYNYGWTYQEFNMLDNAVKEYNEAIRIDSMLYEAHYNLGNIYVNQLKDYNKAITSFSNAIKSDSLAYKAFYNRGFTYEQMGKYKLAESDYRQALRILPNYDPAVSGLNEVIEKIR